MEEKKKRKPYYNKESQLKYRAKQIKRMTFDFNIDTDADILAQLEMQANRQGYIKRLIREDIERERRGE